MTDAQRIYRSIVDFIDQQTEGLPPEIGLKMVRSYASILAEPEPVPDIPLMEMPPLDGDDGDWSAYLDQELGAA